MHDSVEKLLQKYCDEAQVREALHRRAHEWYKRALTWFQLPIIILSACSGSVQLLSKSVGPTYESTIVTCTAGTSILVSIITSVMTYLKLGEFSSKHEASHVAWQNFYNTVHHELSLAQDLRRPSEEFVEEVRTLYSRLFENSPICQRKFMKAIKRRVHKHATEDFSIPTYMNGFSHTKVYREEESEYEDNSV